MEGSGAPAPLDDYLIALWQTPNNHWLTLPHYGRIKVDRQRGKLLIRGRVPCLNVLSLDIRIRLVLVEPGRTLCAVEDYSFQAQWANMPIFRYDNAAHYPEQATAHHRHRFDAAGVQVNPPEHIGAIPSLWEVRDELGAWYSARSA